MTLSRSTIRTAMSCSSPSPTEEYRLVPPRLRVARVLFTPILAAAAAGCGASDIIDDFGTSGYARIEGKVTRANGTSLANSGVFFLCGTDAPTDFGWSVPTDASGRYSIDINAPGPVLLPPSGTLFCRFSAPASTPPIATVERSVHFSATAGARPLTIVDLLEQ